MRTYYVKITVEEGSDEFFENKDSDQLSWDIYTEISKAIYSTNFDIEVNLQEFKYDG